MRYTKDFCEVAAKDYPTCTAFAKGDRGAYRASLAKGWLDEICSHMTWDQVPAGYWTKARCEALALPHRSRSAFKSASPMGYLFARQNGWLDGICAHMEPLKKPPGYWTRERCTAAARGYATRKDFAFGPDSSGYQQAMRKGWLDAMCSHMEDRATSDSNAVYIWRAVGAWFNGKQVFKIGITSQRLGLERIMRTAKRDKLEVDLRLLVPCEDAASVEKAMLAYGDDPKLRVTDGFTEFRALSEDEYDAVMRIAKSERQPA